MFFSLSTDHIERHDLNFLSELLSCAEPENEVAWLFLVWEYFRCQIFLSKSITFFFTNYFLYLELLFLHSSHKLHECVEDKLLLLLIDNCSHINHFWRNLLKQWPLGKTKKASNSPMDKNSFLGLEAEGTDSRDKKLGISVGEITD